MGTNLHTLFALAVLSWALSSPGPAAAAIEDQNLQKKRPEPEPVEMVLTKPPELVGFVEAVYPEGLLQQGIGGEVLLLIDIDPSGEVERVQTQSSSHPGFVEPAMVAVTGFVFSPAEINDQPAGIRIEYRYVFSPKMPEPDAIAGEPTHRAADTSPVNFYGEVKEAGLRIPIAGAIVRIDGRPAAETDQSGRFEIRGLAPGKLAVEITGPNHDTYTVEEELGADEALQARYYLLRTSLNPYETVVRTRAERREVAKVQLERKELEKVPGTFGDPVRVIENLPGMARTPGGLGGALLVRGANPTDTAVFIDGVQIPLLYHFGGLTSVVNARFLDRIDFYPGGFGAEYGNAVAGIVNVITRDLDCEMWRAAAEVDFIDSGAYTCVPVGDWQLAAAARRSYIDVLLPPVLDAATQDSDQGIVTASPVYWDYQVKAHRKWGNHTFDVFAFGSDDRFKLIQSGSTEDINFDFGLHLMFHRLMLRDRWRFGDRVSITSMIAPGYQLNEIQQTSREIGLDNGFELDIWSVDWRETIDIELTEWVSLRGGINAQFGGAGLLADFPFPDEVTSRYPTPVFDFTDSQEFTRDLDAYGHAYWLEAKFDPGAGISVIPGLRLDRFDFHHTQHLALQPRLNVRWQIADGITAKAAYGWYEKLPEPQFILDSPLGNPKLEPLRSHQLIAGYEHEITELINLDVQAFYNMRRRIPSPIDNQTLANDRVIEESWTSDGGGRTYGLEVLLRHLATDGGFFYGWLAYTLSRSTRWDRRPDTTLAIQGDGGPDAFEAADEGTQEYLSPFDQTHILTLVGQFTLPWGLEAGFRFRLVSGNPFTDLSRGRKHHDSDADNYQVDTSDLDRNADRMPSFHQLDVRLDKTWTFDLWKLTAYLEVLNAYNADNVEQFQYDYRFEERVPITFLPIVPILGLKGEF